MTQIAEIQGEARIEDSQEQIQTVKSLLDENENLAVLIERQGDTVRFALMPTYDEETVRFVEEARREHARSKAAGSTREDAIADFNKAADEIRRTIG